MKTDRVYAWDRPGKWTPADQKAHREWMGQIVRRVDEDPQALHPVMQEFQYVIESSPKLYMLFQSMLHEVPHDHGYKDQINGESQIRDYKQLMQVLNHLLTTAPTYNDRKNRMTFVGLPINTVLVWPMGTPSGNAAFLDPEVNRMLHKMLNVWGAYLQSPESAYVLGNSSNTDWFGPYGLHDLTMVGNNYGETNYTFDEMFYSEPEKENRGYTSWDNFFTRHFRPGIRPVAGPDNDSVIVNSCESLPFRIQHNVQARDRFWVKEQPYSVMDMLGVSEDESQIQNSLAAQFVGGTIYQAFLSSLSYHRWHSPVSGRIVKSYVMNGTYFSEPLWAGIADPSNHSFIDPKGVNHAEAYLSAMATRAVVLIEADNPAIGMMAFIGVGMVEVSTCDVTVKEGQHVNKGDELGMFHFGGSTHCLLFREGVNVQGFPTRSPSDQRNFPVLDQVAVVH